MKYIRTKDRIFDTTEMKWCECSKQASYYKDKNYMLYVPLKQADTIEELIDEFIEYNREKNKGFYIREYELEEVKNVIRKEPSVLEHTDIFGAIWTDIGLIYVAKMNEKGELELL